MVLFMESPHCFPSCLARMHVFPVLSTSVLQEQPMATYRKGEQHRHFSWPFALAGGESSSDEEEEEGPAVPGVLTAEDLEGLSLEQR